MSESSLGTVFQRRDQGQSMIFAATGWCFYLVLNSKADLDWSASLVSAIARLGAIFAFFGATVAFLGSMPGFLKVPARLTFLIAFVGGVLQFISIQGLFQIIPDFSSFVETFLIGQFVFSLALFPFAYCLYKHPMFPRWLGIALAVDGVFWSIYCLTYPYEIINHILQMLAWGPFLLIEILVGVYYFYVGSKLSTMPRPSVKV